MNWFNWRFRSSVFMLFLAVSLFSCKESEDVNFDNNDPKSPHRIATIKIENYVNRLFIDLVGRSALDTELAAETQTLKDANLSKTSREDLINKLQNDTAPRVGDSSYNVAYNQRLYDVMKARMCEGADDSEFLRYVGNANHSLKVARLNGDSIGVYAALELIERNQNVVDGKYQLRSGDITINQLFARMMNNNVYDNINMNTFNFVNASFDDLFSRFPTKTEFDAAYSIIQQNKTGALLGGFASTKAEYCTLLTECDEFHEGLIRWAYISLLSREATSQDVVNHFNNLKQTKDFKQLQKEIMVTDEYADF
ncbi:MAG: hypothetical protein H6607_06420 [Flavobacteriales bacterium]|nr:hypothetical protein [Flavobacteriales bacterium]